MARVVLSAAEVDMNGRAYLDKGVQVSAESLEKVKDRELAQWLRSADEDTRELIVQAQTPPRKVTFAPGQDGRVVPDGITKSGGPAREDVIEQLTELLARFVEQPPVVLSSAGAVVVRATRNQVLHFADHPLVKAIYPNRRRRKTTL